MICPRCSKELAQGSTCSCGFGETQSEIQTIFSSAPAIDEARDRKRRNLGLCIALADVVLIAGLLKLSAIRGPNALGRALQTMWLVLFAAGAVFWVVRKADKGNGLALLIAATTLAVLLFTGLLIAIAS